MRTPASALARATAVVDYFTVARIDGRWWITTKTYAHTGGSIPAR